ncbi:MAG: SPASM domain-containing protein [Planctomycetales bacterium]|nr:SPASM domain-containing protein [Planctomycetales bacterium]
MPPEASERVRAAASEGRETLPFGPAWLNIEVTQRCNLWCVMCRDPGQPTGGDLEDRALESLLPHVADARVVVLNGWGEPLVFPGFRALLARVRALAPGALVRFNTNGLLLDASLADLLADPRHPSAVALSCDGATPATYAAIRRGGDLEAALRRLDLLAALKRARGSPYPRLFVEVVLQRRNAPELPGIVDIAVRLGAEAVTVEDVRGGSFGTPLGELIADVEDHLDAYEEACRRASAAGIAVGGSGALRFARALAARRPAAPAAAGAREAPRARRFCYEPFQTAYVKQNGDVRPCCRYPAPFGNLGRDALPAIWNGERWRRLRAAMASGSPDPVCASCMASGHHVPVPHEEAAAPAPATTWAFA